MQRLPGRRLQVRQTCRRQRAVAAVAPRGPAAPRGRPQGPSGRALQSAAIAPHELAAVEGDGQGARKPPADQWGQETSYRALLPEDLAQAFYGPVGRDFQSRDGATARGCCLL